MAIFQAYKWRDLFFDRNFFQKKAGFLAQKHGDSEGVFSDRIFLKKFRGFLPIFRLYMRGLFWNPQKHRKDVIIKHRIQTKSQNKTDKFEGGFLHE